MTCFANHEHVSIEQTAGRRRMFRHAGFAAIPAPGASLEG